MVEFEEAGEEVFAGGGGDGVAGAVVFGEGFDFVEVVAEGDGGAVGAGLVPAVGGEDGLVEFAVEGAELVDGGEGLFLREGAGGGAVLGGDGFGGLPVGGFFALGEELGEAVGGGRVVEEVVDVRQPEPEAEHEVAAVFVIAFADGGEVGVRVLPLPGGEGEGVKGCRGVVTRSPSLVATFSACPNLVNCGL